jgi:hypothetical protein
LQVNPSLAEDLLLACTSAVENYFRAVLTRLMNVCPVSQVSSRTQMISLLAARSYDPVDLGLAVLDGGSLADGKEIKRKTQALLGIQIPSNSDLDAALQEFDKVCHLRHAAVHSRGVLGSRSQAELGLQSDGGPLRLALNFAQLQLVAAVCESAVRSYNRYIFRSIVERWIGSGHISGDWTLDGPHYGQVFDVCYCRVDDPKGQIDPRGSYRAFLAAIGTTEIAVDVV